MSCGTQPANIRVIKRRHKIPSLFVIWNAYKTAKPLTQG